MTRSAILDIADDRRPDIADDRREALLKQPPEHFHSIAMRLVF